MAVVLRMAAGQVDHTAMRGKLRALVKRYKLNTRDISNKLRDQLITDYAPLIRFIAQRIALRLPPNVDIDDLVSSGIIGLMDAIDKYDPSRDNKFRTYAEFRIRGAILDELRSQDWVPRSVRDKAKRIERTNARLEQKHGRSVSEREISKDLGMPLDRYHRMLARVRTVMLVPIDEVTGSVQLDQHNLLEYLNSEAPNDPFINLKVRKLKRTLKENVEALPEKQKLVLSLYYYEELNLKEIGKILNVTESRVSQIHTQALTRLQSKLNTALLE